MENWKEKCQTAYDWLIKNGKQEKYSGAGVYSISIDGKLVYIGKSKDMLWRLASHITEIDNGSIKQNKYKVLHEAKQRGFTVSFGVLYHSPETDEEAINEDIGYIEGVLIRKHLPPLNYQIPKEENYHSFILNKNAKTITLDEIISPIGDYEVK